jgi:peptidoglycan L-alanyl-D-glutamate endopeptidase CwlK
MRKWGRRSRDVYDELDARLQIVLDRVLEEVADISLITGFRGQTEQNGMYLSGNSKLPWPRSKHNKKPSLAVDYQPYPMPQRTEKLWASLAYIAGHMIRIGMEEGVALRWGGDWNGDGDLTDQKFDDLFHVEIDE